MSQSFEQKKLCVLPNLKGIGGPSSFNTMFTTRLASRGVTLTHDAREPGVDAVLIIGGTNQLLPLMQAKRRGVRIVQRLNGMNWIHKRIKSSPRYFLRAELNNRLLAFIRSQIADAIIYQSNFSQNWWQTVYRQTNRHATVIYNGVDTKTFSPTGPEQPPVDRYILQLLEARISGGYEAGLMNAIALAEGLQQALPKPVHLRVIGRVSDELKSATDKTAGIPIEWTGMLPHDQIPAFNRSAHLLFSADLNAACPNAVLEAMACGLPVVAYATGALPELVTGGAGITAPYGSNYWKLEKPDPAMLIEKTIGVLNDLETVKLNAREHALANFDADLITDRYLTYLFTN